MERRKISRVLISVSDKNKLTDFTKELDKLGIEIVSTGGTSKAITESGISVTSVEEVTNFPELMGGRVKTLHPMIFGGILARDSDLEETKKHKINLFDMVVCNLYPFKEAVLKGADLESLVEEIDIGGPSLLRASAKNHSRVAVVSDPEDYDWIISEIKEGGLNLAQRQDLALKAYRHTAEYDTTIQRELSQRFDEEGLPSSLQISGIGSPPLRYGENPHQSAVFYSDIFSSAPSVSDAIQLQGKQLSYNNLLDFDAALSIVAEFEDLTAVVVKHNNPCGAASANSLEEAYDLAINTDPQSSFGGIISFNGKVESTLAEKIISSFKEGVIAPSFSKSALKILSSKQNLRVLETGNLEHYHRNPTLRSLDKGWLLQESDEAMIDISDCKIVTERKPSSTELESLYFAWKIVKHVKSNAIVFAKNKNTVGIGAGQMSRIDSVKIAEFKSIPDAKGCVMSSDAFFPFRDGIDEAVKAGITAVIQPGGSMRDQEVIDAANEHNIAMVFTGMRHFKH
jgi:phosphoribosylaminoimidazolecarboxamide formyltransferase/IMP cyclohydrolase